MENRAEKIIAKNLSTEKEQKAANQILDLINSENLSIAEIRGAAWEAMLMAMKMPVRVLQDK
jgi:hypothetical protein